MDIEFLKMHGLGNDYIFLDCFKNKMPEEKYLPHLAKAISDRHFGVGGDGLVLIMPGEKEKLRMRIFNADGSEAEMCGNAIRCLGRYAYDSGLVNENDFLVETAKRIIHCSVIDSHNLQADMGAPYYLDNSRELKEIANMDFKKYITIEDKEYSYTPVSMGNPHAVLFVTDYNFNLHEVGRQIENHPDFPNRTNVEFVQIYSREEIRMRVWERGSGETLACGTGASASVVASVLNGFTDREVLVHLNGGDLYIEWSQRDNHIYLMGPAEYTFTGTYYYEEQS